MQFRVALYREVAFDQFFSDIAKEQFRSIVEKSETTVLWTDGDDSGFPDLGIPGSREQIRKIAGSKFFNKVRREIAQDRGGINPSDVVSIIATEGKMKYIPNLMRNFKKKNIGKVVIVEDRLNNLQFAKGLIEQVSNNMETFLVWIQHNNNQLLKQGQIEDAKATDSIHLIGDISDLMMLLKEHDVFSEDKKVGDYF